MRKTVGVVSALGLALALAPSALANTYVANKTGDHAPNGCTHSDCTLREAIIKANHHPGPDTVELRSKKTYTRSSSPAAVRTPPPPATST